MLDRHFMSALAGTFRGDLIAPSDPRYDDARAVHNGMIDRRPSLVARCADVADVIAAVNVGRDARLPIAVRGGGHSGPGFGSCDDGLVIDLSRLRGIRVDPGARTVRAEAGCTGADLDHAAHAFGLAVPTGIVSSTGIAGLTLGGGHGHLTRAYGLTVDNLLEADVVLADGRLVTANDRDNTELFWALRGGGGNFGVVTSFVYRAHPVTQVYGGPMFWRIEHAGAVMRTYRDFMRTAPERLCPFIGLKTVPSAAPFPQESWGVRICALISCYLGSAAEGERAMRPIREALPAPLLDWMTEMPFPAVQSMFDALLPKGLQMYWKGDFVKELPDASIDAHIEHASQSPSELSLMHLYPIDGAVHRVETDATAWGCRDAKWSMVIVGIDPDPGKAAALKHWACEYWQAVHPFNLGGGYVNFMMADEGATRVQSSYGTNYPRLSRAKRQYDPDNLFAHNHNIEPAPRSTEAEAGQR
jgi:FAD/FMN-containing dehydrogenase